MERHDLTPLVEALLFAADQPLTVNALLKAIDDDGVERADVKAVLDILAESYAHQQRGFELVRLGKGYQTVTRPRYAPWIENLLKTRRKARLSRAALETVAVIAYKQPISRIGVERVRGVDVGGVLTTLMERGLIMIKGRDPGPGRPLLYGTTERFLDYFGLAKVSDLPQLDELASLAGIELKGWSEGEQRRFEKHGVDLENVPTPESLLHPKPEAAIRDEGDGELENGSATHCGPEGERTAPETEEAAPKGTAEAEGDPQRQAVPADEAIDPASP